jgi:hypothetical protein
MLPTFLLIGANKAGTTSLYHYLKQHPDIYMSPVKEPRFFTAHDEQQRIHQADGSPWGEQVDDLRQYEALFAGATTEQERGEASTTYLPHPDAPRRIRELVPDVKLVAVLRDPSDRAFSMHQMNVRLGLEPLADFGRALEAEQVEHSWRSYLELGFYYAQVKRYLDLFAPQQTRLYLYEEFSADPIRTLKDILGFLGVDPAFAPDVSTKHNVRGQFQAEGVGPSGLTPEVRQKLVEAYRQDILQLQDLIQRDLSAWLK